MEPDAPEGSTSPGAAGVPRVDHPDEADPRAPNLGAGQDAQAHEKSEREGGRGEAAGAGGVPVVLMCVGVPWDAVLQGMLHAAVGGRLRSAGRLLTLDISLVASTLGQRRSGYSAEGYIQEPLTGEQIGGQLPRADPIDHTTLLRHFTHALRTSRHVAMLVTTALVPPSPVTDANDRYSRRALYAEMFASRAAAGYPRPWVVEALHGYTGQRSPLLEDRAARVLYTQVSSHG